MSRSPWYQNGLRFECTGCGACCMGAGRVWVSIDDLQRLALCLDLSLEDCVHLYAERISGRWALKEKTQKGQCTFLSEQGRCTVYTGRPQQCQSFPWWPTVLASPQQWQEAARTCEGIDYPTGPIIPYTTIQSQLMTEKSARKKRT